MPAAVWIESMLETVAVAFGEEGEEVAAGFVPDLVSCSDWITGCFNGIVDVVVVVEIGIHDPLSLDKESVVSDCGFARLVIFYRTDSIHVTSPAEPWNPRIVVAVLLAEVMG